MSEPVVDETLYYFGCWAGVGHYLRLPNGRDPGYAGPFRDFDLDGYYAPRTEDHPKWKADPSQRRQYQDETLAALYHIDGWTLLAMWDRSVDMRHGSNCVFLKQGMWSHEDMWFQIKMIYPSIYARLKAAPK
jgi:hypothetical protein